MYAGLGPSLGSGWSGPFKERGHEVFTVDWDKAFDVDLHIDINKMTAKHLPWKPDIVLASPPCEAFSVLQIGRNWTKPTDDPPNHPKTPQAEAALELLHATVRVIRETKPRFHVIENPRAKMRRVIETFYPKLERQTVTYCQYGEDVMKPTDLFSAAWNRLPSLELKPACKNGDPCHVRAPRGSTTGIQGGERYKRFIDSLAVGEKKPSLAAFKAVVPKELSLAFCLAAEKDLA